MMRSFLYHPDGRLERDIPIERYRDALKEPKALLWVDIEAPEDTDVEVLLEVFELHPLTVEDCIMPNLRPKIEEFESYLFVVLQGMLRDDDRRLQPVELDVCLGKNFLVTVQSRPIKAVEEQYARVGRKSPVIKRGADFLFYSLADALIDGFFPILDEVEARVDDLETRLLADATKSTLAELFSVYSELMVLRRTLVPHREILSRLNRGDLAFIRRANAMYFRDIYDHLLRLTDSVDACRDVTTMALEAHATIASNRLNEIMKTLTAMATLALPLLLITGVYGMNFGENPGLGPRWVYHGISGCFLLSVPVMLYYFRKARWL